MKVRWRGITELRQGLANLRKRLFPSAVERIHRTANEIRKEMNVPGKPPTYPIKWDTPKQKRAFFATNGFGRGIPTRRSNNYVEKWQAIKLENGADVGNPLSHAGYIGGTARGRRQSRIHKGRWPVFRIVVNAAIEKLPKGIRDRLAVVVRQEGFRTK